MEAVPTLGLDQLLRVSQQHTVEDPFDERLVAGGGVGQCLELDPVLIDPAGEDEGGELLWLSGEVKQHHQPTGIPALHLQRFPDEDLRILAA